MISGGFALSRCSQTRSSGTATAAMNAMPAKRIVTTSETAAILSPLDHFFSPVTDDDCAGAVRFCGAGCCRVPVARHFQRPTDVLVWIFNAKPSLVTFKISGSGVGAVSSNVGRLYGVNVISGGFLNRGNLTVASEFIVSSLTWSSATSICTPFLKKLENRTVAA